jgi:hypothetical protein
VGGTSAGAIAAAAAAELGRSSETAGFGRLEQLPDKLKQNGRSWSHTPVPTVSTTGADSLDVAPTRLADNFYVLCNGTTPEGSNDPAVTDWLHEQIWAFEPAEVQRLFLADVAAHLVTAMRHVASADIEHFGPKAGVKHDRDEPVLVKPGYYRLAAKWDDLLPSCIDCNRGRAQLTADDIDDGEVSGKKNFFPLTAAPGSRLDHRSWIARDDNRRHLLVRPCRDRPDAHFEFHFNGTVTGTTRKGRVTISVLGLDQLALNRACRELVLELAKRIRTITVMARVPQSDQIRLTRSSSGCSLNPPAMSDWAGRVGAREVRRSRCWDELESVDRAEARCWIPG